MPRLDDLAPAPDLVTVTLAHAADAEGFRAACRRLWAAQVAPERVAWRTADAAEGDLFADVESATLPPPLADVPPLRVPQHLLGVVMHAGLHADVDRHALLWRLLWRLQREPGLRDDALDPDVVRTKQMAQAVRRDMHKMTAFVRFRTVEEDARAGPLPPLQLDPDSLAAFDGAAIGDLGAVGAAFGAGAVDSTPSRPGSQLGGPLHVAWFEPEHHTLEATAPFFMRRFASMRFAILTPERSVEWDGVALAFGPGARREQAPPADAGEALWLTYYENIFNPARLKVAMMKREMPVRYWKNLPEAERITPLVASARERTLRMVEQTAGAPSPRRAVAPDTPRPKHPAPTPALASLADRLERCRECPIGEHATQAVPGHGPKRARLMFVGEQPGDVEDLKGLPFVGPAGQLFDRALAQLGIERSVTWVSNAVKHFKYELRGKRRIHKTPSQQEAAACLHWLEEEIGLVDPDAIIALGATAARSLMHRPVAVTRERGQWLERPDGRRVLITLHPSALLRMDPADKEAAWAAWLADLAQVQSALKAPAR